MLRRPLAAPLFPLLLLLLSLSLLLPFPPLCAQTPTLTTADAIHHIGRRATVCGPIAATRRAAAVPGLPTLIDLGRSSPSSAFTVILWDSDRSRVGNFPTSGDVCVTGVITQYKGIPQMVLEDATSWTAKNPPAPNPIPANRPPVPSFSASNPPTHSSPAPSPPAPSPPASSPLTPAPATPRASPHPISPSPTPAPSIPAASYRIGADDSLRIAVWQEPNLSGTFLVRPDGMISLVLAGDVRAAGLTPPALAAELTRRFKKYLQDPLVSVIVAAPNSQKVYVLGEVQHVGPIAMATAMSPLQAISAAGGLTQYAKKSKIYILRGPQGRQRKIPFNYKAALNARLSSSIPLQAGDTIVVP